MSGESIFPAVSLLKLVLSRHLQSSSLQERRGLVVAIFKATLKKCSFMFVCLSISYVALQLFAL
jgi:hypothetical protein